MILPAYNRGYRTTQAGRTGSGGQAEARSGNSIQLEGFGSGFIVHKDGYIFTNAHVVGDIANRSINTYGSSEYSAQVVAQPDQRKLDLAILKIDSNIGSPGKFYN